MGRAVALREDEGIAVVTLTRGMVAVSQVVQLELRKAWATPERPVGLYVEATEL